MCACVIALFCDPGLSTRGGAGVHEKTVCGRKGCGGSSVVLSDLQVLRTRHAVMSQACVIKLQHKDLKTYKCDL